MRTLFSFVGGIVIALALIGVAVFGYLRTSGLDSRGSPGAAEARMAKMAGRVALPASVRALHNPVTATSESAAEGMAHFADHCSVCHANRNAATAFC
jgi:mono/diheme cytochrome c family protein